MLETEVNFNMYIMYTRILCICKLHVCIYVIFLAFFSSVYSEMSQTQYFQKQAKEENKVNY